MSIFYVIATISGLIAALIAIDDLKASFEHEKPESESADNEEQA